MTQKKIYTKEELKKGMKSELSIDFELYVDDLAKWLTNYLIEHHFSRHVKKDASMTS